MTELWQRFQRALLPLLGLTGLAVIITWLGPAEKTMGYGIRPVYVHVALIWTGLVGLAATGLLGLALAVQGRSSRAAWLETIGWITLGFLAASFIASTVAQLVNWNGIFLDEPRSQAAGRAIIVLAVVQVAGRWLSWYRLRGLAMATVAPLLIASMYFSPLVLHPADPITSADSWGIILTFAALTLNSLAAAGLLVWVFRPKSLDASHLPAASVTAPSTTK